MLHAGGGGGSSSSRSMGVVKGTASGLLVSGEDCQWPDGLSSNRIGEDLFNQCKVGEPKGACSVEVVM